MSAVEKAPWMPDFQKDERVQYFLVGKAGCPDNPDEAKPSMPPAPGRNVPITLASALGGAGLCCSPVLEEMQLPVDLCDGVEVLLHAGVPAGVHRAGLGCGLQRLLLLRGGGTASLGGQGLGLLGGQRLWGGGLGARATTWRSRGRCEGAGTHLLQDPIPSSTSPGLPAVCWLRRAAHRRGTGCPAHRRGAAGSPARSCTWGTSAPRARWSGPFPVSAQTRGQPPGRCCNLRGSSGLSAQGDTHGPAAPLATSRHGVGPSSAQEGTGRRAGTSVRAEAPLLVRVVVAGGGTPELPVLPALAGAGAVGLPQEGEGEDAGVPLGVAADHRCVCNAASEGLTPAPQVPTPQHSWGPGSPTGPLCPHPARTSVGAEAVLLVLVEVGSGRAPAVAIGAPVRGAGVVGGAIEDEGEDAGGPVAVATVGVEH